MPISESNAKRIELVQPLVGTDGMGHCLIGPYLPMGLIRIGPDAALSQPNNGYKPGMPIGRFSHMHVSGTGGPPRYGHVALTPFCGEPGRRRLPPYIRAPLDRLHDGIPRQEETAVGYYAARLMPWDVQCELTCSRHVGVHRYSYPADRPARLLFDAAAVLNDGQCGPGTADLTQAWDSETGNIGGWMQWASSTELIGRSDFRGGWGHDKSYSIYYSFQSDQPWQALELATQGGYMPMAEGDDISGQGIRCVLAYPAGAKLNLRVGISYVSIANARAYVQQEAAGRSFEAIRAANEAEWEELLSAYRIDGGTLEQRQMFYSALYRLYSMPTDLGVDQENPYWRSGVRQFTDYYCLWDSIRNANSFFHVFDPGLSRDMMNSLLDIADHTGWLPDAHIAHQHGYMQSACACDILYPEAALKGLEGIDYVKALQYLRKNNEHRTPDVLVKGRYIDDYNTLGYLSTNVPKGSVSRHLEYAYHDWCISRLAEQLGDEETASRYREQALRVWNLWNPETGTFYPRNPDGSWLTGYDPWTEPPEGWNDPSCYEGSTAVWSLNVFQDFHGLIGRMGGPEAFMQVLDRIFEAGLFHVKETRMHIPHLYTYAGRPDLAADRVRESMAQFRPIPDGLPDNEDFGCQSGYYLWHAMGLYPIYGQTHYMLTPPLFDRVETGMLTVTAEREGQGLYIQAVTLGGAALDRAWITHDELRHAKTLHYVLGDRRTDWGTKQLPPNGV